MKKSEYIQYDGLGLADLVKKNEVSAEELVEVAIEMIDATNPQLNAVINPMYDIARKRAAEKLPDGPFKGVPFLFKDLVIDYADVPTSFGCRYLKDYTPSKHSELAEHYLNSGVIVLGKTNLPEWGASPTTESDLWGATHNPWDLSLTSGGSSGGSGAAVAARMVPLAHGNDIAGSLRIPASCCGVFSLKPTRGLVPVYKDLTVMQNMYSDHVISRSVRDNAAMLDCTAKPQMGNPITYYPPEGGYLKLLNQPVKKLRIAFTKSPVLPATLDSECLHAVHEAVKLCEELGHEVEELSLNIDPEEFMRAIEIIFFSSAFLSIQISRELMENKDINKGDFEPASEFATYFAKAFTAKDYIWAIRFMDETRVYMEMFFTGHDVILSPTLGSPPVKLGKLKPTKNQIRMINFIRHIPLPKSLKLKIANDLFRETLEFVPYTMLFNVTGQPAMNVPLHWNKNNIPIGVQFAGKQGDDGLLFQLAQQLQEARDWTKKIPPIVSG